MIDFHFSPTPNGLKVRLFLEEAELAHRIVPVSLSRGEQLRPDYLKISPNGKIPAIVDYAPRGGGEPIAIFESGAILVYLAEKTGRFLPTDLRGRMDVLQWVFWQVGGLGPMAGQIGHFNVFASEKVPYAIDRYTREVHRLYGVLDRRLAGREYIAGDYSIADMASYPWIVPHAPHGQHLADFPHLARWFETMRNRPGTRATYDGVTCVYGGAKQPLSDEARRILFGKSMPSELSVA
ncbi:MAG TPA: glutathione S-transferase N-terminal domain-containing protein [Rhodanobacteraceae bacterium]|nr:glutathione S-transferase N-terminal domain-containing protein [Rhodanobacteraceae bacterium]